MKGLRITWLTKNNLHYVSNKIGTKWDGDLDGSIVNMCIDKAFPEWVRIGVNDVKQEVLFFNKKLFTDFLKSNPKFKELTRTAIQEFKKSDGYDEFEYYQEYLEQIIDEYYTDEYTKYINAYDFILDTLLETKKVFCDCCDSAWIKISDYGQKTHYVCTMCRENEPERFKEEDSDDTKIIIDAGN